MAKIDIAQIEGYSDELTAEEKLTLLENYDVPELEKQGGEKMIAKRLFDKTASELAAAKKQLREKLTDEETQKLEAEQTLQNMQTELGELRKSKTVSEHMASFLALGYDNALARETAEAMADGDTSRVFANQSKFLSNRESALKAELLKNTPAPPAGSGTSTIDYTKEIETASAAGDYTKVAYLTRIAAQEKKE